MSGSFSTNYIDNTLYIYYKKKLLSIEYTTNNHVVTKVLFNEDGTFFKTVVFDNDKEFVYYHISGNEYGGLYSIEDKTVVVIEATEYMKNQQEKVDDGFKYKINYFRSLIKNQTVISIPKEILEKIKIR